MRIAIEALGIHYVGGGRTATLNLLEPLFHLDKQNEYLVILSQPEPSLQAAAGNVRQWIAPFRNRFALRVWAQLFLPLRLRGYELTHFVKNLGVFGVPTRSVVTMHDLTTLIFSDMFPASEVWYWRHVQPLTLRSVDRIVAVSHTTAKDVLAYYPIAANKIRVIYNGVGTHLKPAPLAAISAIRGRYQLPEQYMIFVGRLDRKKNLTMLAQAFAQFRRQFPLDVKLVIVGEEYPKTRDPALYEAVENLGLQEQVVFTGRVPDHDVPVLLSGALLAVFPSLHEGFGLSAIEAMACGTPLVTSAAGGLVEVVADAAEVVQRPEAEAFAEALLHVAGDHERRADLRRRGIERAQSFRRENTAQLTLELYREVAG